MSRSFFAFCLTSALVFNAGKVFAQVELNANPAQNQNNEARVIVKFRQGSALLRNHTFSATADALEAHQTVTDRANSMGIRLGLNLSAGRPISQQTQVISASGVSGTALATLLAAEPDVEYAVLDQRRRHMMVPNDPYYLQGPPISGNTAGGPIAGQWYLHAPAGEVASSINAPGAWGLTTGAPNIVVAVLDTGVRFEHPDLAGRLLPGYDMVSDLATANDGNARDSDPSDPGDWVTASEAANPSSSLYGCTVENSSWHGTLTSSILGAASNNGIGMTGVAWGVQLLPVRVLGKCGGYDSDIIAGMQWAAGLAVPGVPANPNPARVINMSLGSSGLCSQSYIDAINTITSQQNSVSIVIAAGNDSLAVSSPADCPGVISVAGLRHYGTKVGFSSLGPEITLSAPGGNCVNTSAGSACLYPILGASNSGLSSPLSSTYTDSFNPSLGTSFSAPLVAGTVALMLSVQPALTLAEIKAALQSSARTFPFRGVPNDVNGPIPACHAPTPATQSQCYCTTTTCGAGMLDAASAVAAALGLQPRISVTQSTLHPGEMVTLSSLNSLVGSGRTVATVQWSIVDGGGVVNTFLGGANTPLATLIPLVRGPFSVRLTVTDNLGVTASAETTLSVLPGVSLLQGWNLLGNSVNSPFTVASVFGNTNNVSSVWKWLPATKLWAFYSPSLANGGADYAKSKGYDPLTVVNGGEGFWVNAINPFTAILPTGTAISSTIFADQVNGLSSGWSLIAIGDNQTPVNFVNTIALTKPVLPVVAANSVYTLWAWDSNASNWYFYAPDLDNSGALADYVLSKNYLNFATPVLKSLDQTMGFWVNHS
jgi:serine protease